MAETAGVQTPAVLCWSGVTGCVYEILRTFGVQNDRDFTLIGTLKRGSGSVP